MRRFVTAVELWGAWFESPEQEMRRRLSGWIIYIGASLKEQKNQKDEGGGGTESWTCLTQKNMMLSHSSVWNPNSPKMGIWNTAGIIGSDSWIQDDLGWRVWGNFSPGDVLAKFWPWSIAQINGLGVNFPGHAIHDHLRLSIRANCAGSKYISGVQSYHPLHKVLPVSPLPKTFSITWVSKNFQGVPSKTKTEQLGIIHTFKWVIGLGDTNIDIVVYNFGQVFLFHNHRENPTWDPLILVTKHPFQSLRVLAYFSNTNTSLLM